MATTTLANVLAFLEADAALAALVGTRLYPVRLPQSPGLPAMTFAVVSGFRWHAFTGPLGLVRQRVQWDIFASTYNETVAIADVFRLRLDGYSGPANGGEIQAAFFRTERDLFEESVELYRRSIDYDLFLPEDTS